VGTRYLRRELSAALKADGFVSIAESGRGRCHMKQIDDNQSYIVDTGPLVGHTDVSPFVGLRHDNVERTVAELTGFGYSPHHITVGGNAGSVLWGRDATWTGNTLVDQSLAGAGVWLPPTEVVDAVFGCLDLLTPYVALPALPRLWKRLEGFRSSPFTVVTVHLMLGDKRGTLNALRRAEANLGSDSHIAAQFFRFSDRVRQRLAN
jgi:hypothetical protein